MNESAGDEPHRRAANTIDSRVLDPADIARSIKISWLTRYATEPAIRRVGSLLAIALFVLIGHLVFKELQAVAWDHVREALKAITWLDIAVSILATAVSYIALIGYDFLALRQVGQRNVPLSLVSITSFIAHSLSFSLGFGALTGGAVRLRLYGAAGLAPEKVVSTGILCALTFWLGLAAVTSLSLIVDPYAVDALTGAGARTIRGLGIAIVLAIAGWIAVSAVRPIPQDVHGWSFPLPGAAATLNSVLVGTLDTVAAAFALWLLLPTGTEVSFAHFVVVFSVATAIGVASHVPGGLGVFEGLIVLGLPQVPEAALIASLVLYRLIYYVLPLALAAAMLSYHEARRQSAAIERGALAIAAIATPVLPAVTATAVFLGGLVLLISSALPAEADRIAVLSRLLPLPFVEASHFFSSIVGSLLLIVAHGLIGRMRSAWFAALILLVAGAIFSLAKGFDYEEAVICFSVVLLLFAGRHHFYRRGGILSGHVSQTEILAILTAVGVSIWLGMAVYRNVDYTNSLWWDFAYHGDAPRFLRASLGIAVSLLVVTVYHLLHRTSAVGQLATDAERARAIALIGPMARTEPNLARLGDKHFLFSDDGFVMYGVQGSSWIAMGEPVAQSQDDMLDLIWRYKELVDKNRGKPVFYQVSSDYLPLYLDAGFSLVKLGEEALVDLATFTIEGSERRRLRQTYAKAQRSNAVLEILLPDQIPPLLDELREVSEAWLTTRGSAEKGFSLGFWSDDYILQQPIAVVRHEGRIVAFANLWKTDDKNEFAVDLMRHRPDAPSSVMDLMFTGLMLEAKSQGFRWFNLGMAPLSGLPQHRLASRWSRIGRLFFRHADRFYNFEGLRAFKSKFKPEWRPKYLAYPGGLTLAQVLIDIVALIAESPKRVASSKQE